MYPKGGEAITQCDQLYFPPPRAPNTGQGRRTLVNAPDIAIWTVAGALIGASLTPAARHVAHRLPHRGLLLAVASTLTGTVFGLLAWRMNTLPALLGYSAFAALAVPLALVDAAEHRLPRSLVHSTYGASMLLLATAAVIDGDLARIGRALAGLATCLVTFLLIGVLRPGDLGAGDVRLAGVVGWTLAWHSWPTLALGGVAFTVLSLALLAATRRSHIPAGPPMLTGAVAALLL